MRKTYIFFENIPEFAKNVLDKQGKRGYNVDVGKRFAEKKNFKEGNNMKSTGMVRKVDELGRIVLPAEIRQNMDIETRDSLEIYTDGERIVLQKYHPACIFCTNADNLVYFNQKRICPECLAKIKALD